MKKPSALFFHTLIIGLTTLTVGFSASKRASMKAHKAKKVSSSQLSESPPEKDTSPTYKTLADSLGSPAPVLKADGRSPQSIETDNLEADLLVAEAAKKKVLN